MKKNLFLKIAIVFIGCMLLAAPSRRPDPENTKGTYKFAVLMDGVITGYFSSISGLGIEQDVIEFQDGDDPLVRKRPGRVRYNDIILKQGYLSTSTLNDWLEQYSVSANNVQTRNITIVLYDISSYGSSTEIKRWNCFNCFPKSWKLSPLEGKEDEVLTEELVISIDYFEEA